jgi:hypothetical protein
MPDEIDQAAIEGIKRDTRNAAIDCWIMPPISSGLPGCGDLVATSRRVSAPQRRAARPRATTANRLGAPPPRGRQGTTQRARSRPTPRGGPLRAASGRASMPIPVRIVRCPRTGQATLSRRNCRRRAVMPRRSQGRSSGQRRSQLPRPLQRSEPSSTCLHSLRTGVLS